MAAIGLKSGSMPPNFGLGSELKGKTLGIWGYGKIGKIVAGYGRAFGMEVQIWGSELARVDAVQDGYTISPSREHFFETSDVLSVHLRLSETTLHCINAADLARMKPTALLVNTSHTDMLDTNVLIGALNRGRPGMAAIDVFETEPILQGHALLRLENCICTPHIGYVESNNYEKIFSSAFDNIVNFMRSTPSNIINPAALQVLKTGSLRTSPVRSSRAYDPQSLGIPERL